MPQPSHLLSTNQSYGLVNSVCRRFGNMVHSLGRCCDPKKNLIILYAILTTLPSSSLQLPVLSRRSALEAGHVSFPSKPHPLRTSSTVAPTAQSLKLTTVVPAVRALEKVEAVKPLSVAVTTTAATGHIRREWIPGHVKHHAYIPAHARNVFVPASVLSTVIIPTSSQRYHLYEDDRYRSHYGGFGVGVDYGGQGAGHGFQVAL